MASAFGFPQYPQSPSPDPREVGRMLGQPQQPQQTMMPPPPADGDFEPVGYSGMAGERVGGRGQMGTGSAPPGQPNYANDDEPDANINASVGDALGRLAGGVMAAPDMTTSRAARRRSQLLHLGVSEFEADLLARSGGI